MHSRTTTTKLQKFSFLAKYFLYKFIIFLCNKYNTTKHYISAHYAKKKKKKTDNFITLNSKKIKFFLFFFKNLRKKFRGIIL